MTNRATIPGQPAQPVLVCSSVRDLTGQSMPRVQASRTFSCSMNPVTPTLVPKPKFVHWPGCQGTHEARHPLFHCPFYSSTGKEPLGAVHTFGSGLQGQVPKQGRPKRLPEGQVCKPDKAIFTQIDPLNTLPPTPMSGAQGRHTEATAIKAEVTQLSLTLRQAGWEEGSVILLQTLPEMPPRSQTQRSRTE